MAENPNRRLANNPSSEQESLSPADMKAAIRETRDRLATHVTGTADHVYRLATTPSSVEAEPSVGGLASSAIKVIALAGSVRGIWADAKRTGRLRQAAFGGAVVIAALVAAKTWRN